MDDTKTNVKGSSQSEKLPIFVVGLAVIAISLIVYYISIGEYCNCISIASDGIFTMSPSGSLPAFHFEGIYNRTYIGYYTSDSKVELVYYDEDSKELSDSVTLWSDWGDGDDHAGPSVLVLQHQKDENSIHNGKILVATSRIFDNPPMQVRRSIKSEDISEWEDPITFDSNGMYPIFVELSDGTIVLFYMKREYPGEGDLSQCYRISEDGGETWSDRNLLFEPNGSRRIYGVYYTNSDGDQIHAMFNRCPLDPEFGSWYKDIYYAYYDGNTKSWKRVSGKEYILPLDPTSADLVYETDSTLGVEDHTWLSDIKVDNDNNPYLISINYKDYGSSGHNPGNNPGWDGVVQRHNFEGDSWNTEIISENGTGQFGSYSYPAMAILDESNLDVVYLTPYDDDKKTMLQKCKKENGIWGKVEDITKNQEGYSFRPNYVRNAGELKVLWCYTEKYDHHRGDQWESMILGYPNIN